MDGGGGGTRTLCPVAHALNRLVFSFHGYFVVFYCSADSRVDSKTHYYPWSASLSLFIASFCIVGSTCEYTSIVILMAECPSISWTIFGFVPSASKAVAALCLRS